MTGRFWSPSAARPAGASRSRSRRPTVGIGRSTCCATGFEVHLAHPLGSKALRKRKRVKTDPPDAYELANLLRLGSLLEAYIAPPDLRELRELVRHRRQLVKLSGVRALAQVSARSPNS